MTGGRPRRTANIVLALLAVGVLSGCESSQQQSARMARVAKTVLFDQHGLEVAHSDRSIEVVSTAVIHDANGIAAVVLLRNRSAQTQQKLPVSLTVLDRHGNRLYRNDLAGLATSLVQLSSLGAHAAGVWVDDQITAMGTPGRATVRIGQPASVARVHGGMPSIAIGGVHVVNQPGGGSVSQLGGESAQGTVVNRSTVTQTNLVIFCVARHGGHVVAAGRAIIPNLLPRKPTPFTIFFIGNPVGAALQLSAPPTVLS